MTQMSLKCVSWTTITVYPFQTLSETDKRHIIQRAVKKTHITCICCSNVNFSKLLLLVSKLLGELALECKSSNCLRVRGACSFHSFLGGFLGSSFSDYSNQSITLDTLKWNLNIFPLQSSSKSDQRDLVNALTSSCSFSYSLCVQL